MKKTIIIERMYEDGRGVFSCRVAATTDRRLGVAMSAAEFQNHRGFGRHALEALTPGGEAVYIVDDYGIPDGFTATGREAWFHDIPDGGPFNRRDPGPGDLVREAPVDLVPAYEGGPCTMLMWGTP